MKIPFECDEQASLTLDLIINTEYKTVTIDLATGISDISKNSVSIYPNPTSNKLTICGLANFSNNPVATICDIKGKLIKQISLNYDKSEIDISNFSNGIYIVKIMDDNGNLIKSEKIVKE